MNINSTTIGNDLTTYIRGKDDYLQKIEDLKTDAQTDYAYSDTSDPYVAQRASNYLNYLTILEGRQQGRYDNFLKLATDSNMAQLQQMQNLYDSTYAKAKEAYNFEAGITKESYDNIKNMFKDMYNNIDAQEEKLRDRERFDWERKENAANLLIKEVQLKGLEDKTVDESDYYNKYDEKLVHNTLFHSYNADNAINDFDTFDPAVIASGAYSNKIRPVDAVNEFFSLHKKDLTARLANNDTSTLDKYDRIIKQYNNLLSEYDEKEKQGTLNEADKINKETIQGYVVRLSNLVDNSKKKVLSSLIGATPAKGIRSMLEDLVGVGGLGFDTLEKADDKRDFIKESSDYGVSKELASLVFDKYQSAMNGDKTYYKVLRTALKNNTDEELVDVLKRLVN